MKSPDWLRILTASPRQRLPGGVQLRLLTAQEVLEARREATALAGEDRDRALCSNALPGGPGRWCAGGVRCMGPGRRFCTG